MTDCLLAARRVHEDSSHGFRSRREKMAALVPTTFWPIADQAKVGFVNQGSRLQRLPGFLLGEVVGGQWRSSS